MAARQTFLKSPDDADSGYNALLGSGMPSLPTAPATPFTSSQNNGQKNAAPTTGPEALPDLSNLTGPLPTLPTDRVSPINVSPVTPNLTPSFSQPTTTTQPTYTTNARAGNAPGQDDGGGGGDGSPGTGGNRTPPPTGDSGRHGGNASPFTSASTAADLIAYLNKNKIGPGDALTGVTKDFFTALGIYGQAVGNGMTYGQYDPMRQKIYAPGHDIRFENGQWVDHPTGGSDASAAGDAGVEAALAKLLAGEGMTTAQASVFAQLMKIIASGGALPNDPEILQQQLETARENEVRAEQSQLADARGELAARGLLSEPGSPQGEEASAINRIEQGIAPAYSQAVRDIHTTQLNAQNERVTNALAEVTGLSNAAAGNLVSALGTGTQRQIGLANIALGELAQNTQWNEFLAQYGLSRDALQYQIEQGNLQVLLPLLQQFVQYLQTLAAGKVPS